LKRTGS